MNVSAAVLAGGLSTRMGRDKALIELDGRTLVEHVVERLRAVSDDVFVVTKRPGELEHLGLRVVEDGSDVHTPLVGIARALRAAVHPYVFVCACDMPFVSPNLIRLIASGAAAHDVAVPRRSSRPEPSHAVWSADVAPALDACLSAGERAVYRVLDTLSVAWIDEDDWSTVDPSGSSFVNLNTPADLARAEGLD